MSEEAENRFNPMQQRLVKLLGQGVTQKAAADACGVTPAYVCQCLAEEAFAQAVSDLKSARLVQYADRDKLADDIQYQALQRLQAAVRVTTKVGDLLNIVSKMDTMKRSNATPVEIGSAQVVTVLLPTSLLPVMAVTVDQQNRVIDIGGNTMLPASNQEVERLAGVATNGRKTLSGPQE